MKILLTGAAGFLAHSCLKDLYARGHQVVTTDLRGQVDYLGDLADAGFCAQLPAVDAVVHTAAVQYVSYNLPLIKREEYFQRNNVQATRNLCSRYEKDKDTHFVNIGTSMMYDQNGSEVYSTDSAMNEQQGVYSRTKLAAQAFVDALPNRKVTIIPPIIGGIGREGLFRPFVTMVKRFGVVVVPGPGRHKISVVHVDDAASMIGNAVDRGITGLFNVAAPEPLSIVEWAEVIRDKLAVPRVRYVHLPLMPLWLVSWLTGYRVLAREQLLMLAQPHVLEIEESLATGWRPRFDSEQVVREIVHAIGGGA